MPSIFSRIPSNQAQNANLQFSEQAIAVLGPNVCKALAGRQLEIKVKGASEIEELIKFYQEKELSVAREQTSAILRILLQDFLESSQRNIQIGGLIGVMGAARGLQDNLKYYLGQIMVPVFKKFSESSDTVLRYHAAECVYNLCLFAPLGVVCLLDELLDLVFSLWKDSDTRLARPASLTDALVRDLTLKHATPTQVLSLLRSSISEIASKPATPPLYVLPWIDMLTRKISDISTAPVAEVIVSVIQTGSCPISEEQLDVAEAILERLVNQMRGAPQIVPADVLKVVDSKVQKMLSEPNSCSLLTSLVSALCGLSPSRRRISVNPEAALNEVPDPETQEYMAGMASALLPLLMSLLRHSGLNTGYIKTLSTRVQRAVSSSPQKNVLQLEVAPVISECLTMGRNTSNYLVIESALDWLSFLSSNKQLELPTEALTILSSLVSNDRASIRQLAVNCIVSVVQDSSSLQPVLNEAIKSLAAVETPSQALSSIQTIQDLLGQNNVKALNAALDSMGERASSDTEKMEYMMAVYLATYLLYSSNLYVALLDPSGWRHTTATRLLGDVLANRPIRISMNPNIPVSHILSHLEVILMILSLPNLAWSKYQNAGVISLVLKMLPASSPAVAAHRNLANTESVDCIAHAKGPGQLSSSAYIKWETVYMPRLRAVLYRLISQSLSSWSVEHSIHREAEKEAMKSAALTKSMTITMATTPAKATAIDSEQAVKSSAYAGDSDRQITGEWTEEEATCQDTPTKEEALASATNSPKHVTSTPTEQQQAPELDASSADGEAVVAQGGSQMIRPETATPIGTVIDQSINESRPSTSLISELSTGPSSPSPGAVAKGGRTRLFWS